MDTTRRSLIIGAVSYLTYPSIQAFAAQKNSSFDYHLKAVRFAANTYAVIGKTQSFSTHNGGAIVNTAFIDTDEGVVLIDTGPSRRYGEQLNDLIKSTTGKSVIRVYNTHFHPDHCFGNQVFKNNIIAALPKTISGLKESGEAFSDNLYRLLGDWMRGTEVTIPEISIAFSSEKFGRHQLELIPLAGHTDADLVIVDHKTGVMFVGDLCFYNRAPTTPHAHLENWQTSLKKLKHIPHKMILPGHGPVDADDSSVEQTSNYLKWLENSLLNKARAGEDMIDAARLEIPDKFQNMSVIKEEIERSVAHLYPGMEQKILPLATKN